MRLQCLSDSYWTLDEGSSGSGCMLRIPHYHLHQTANECCWDQVEQESDDCASNIREMRKSEDFLCLLDKFPRKKRELSKGEKKKKKKTKNKKKK